LINKLALLLFAVCASAGIVFCQSAPLSISEVLAALDSSSPVLAEARVELALARTEFTSARALPNPMLFTEQENLSNDGNDMKESTVGARQELGFLWSLGPRISAGRNTYRAGQANYAEIRRALEMEVILSIYRTVSQRNQLAIMDTVLHSGRRIEQAVLARQQAGKVSGFDAERVRIEILTLANDRASLEADYGATRIDLIQLTGLPSDAFADNSFEQTAEIPFGSSEEAVGYAHEHRPLLAQTEYEFSAARRAVTAARLDMLPNLNLGVGQKKVEEDFRGIVWEAELEIPLFQQRRSQLHVLRARQREASVNRTARELQVGQEVRSAFERWTSLKQTEKAAMDTLATNARRNIERASRLYTEGRLSTLELVDALRSGFESFAAAAELGQSRLTADLELRRTSGLPIWE